jgi:hypothetical protein
MQDYQLGQAMPAWQQALNATDIANNQHVQGMAKSMGSQLNQNLQEKALPGVRAGAARSGGLGGSRQALAEAIAIRENQGQRQDFRGRQLGELGSLSQVQAAQRSQGLADLYNQSYAPGLGARTAALGMTGAMQDAAGLGAKSRLAAGALQEERQQKEIDADRARHEYYRDYPAKMAQLYGSLFSSANVPFGTESESKSSSSSYGSQKSSNGIGSLGGLAGLFSAFA